MSMLANFVLELCNAPGTAAIMNLAGPPTGRRSFAAAFSSGSTVYYFMDDGAQAEWGIGVFTAGSPNTLQRQTVIGNTANTTSPLNFTGTVRVYNDCMAERFVTLDSGAIGEQLLGKVTVPTGGIGSYGFAMPAALNFFTLDFDITSDSSTSANVLLLISTDGGATYPSTIPFVGSYVWYGSNGPNGHTGNVTVSPSGTSFSGRIQIVRSSAAINYSSHAVSSGGNPITGSGSARASLGGVAPTNVALLLSTGNLAAGSSLKFTGG